jgi:hypothetical protein
VHQGKAERPQLNINPEHYEAASKISSVQDPKVSPLNVCNQCKRRKKKCDNRQYVVVVEGKCAWSSHGAMK